MIWGFAFIAISVVPEELGAFGVNFARFALGGLVLLPVIAVREKISPDAQRKNVGFVRYIAVGSICGLALAAVTVLQQIGIHDTTVGKAGFITTLYIFIVPIIGVITGKKCSPIIIPCVIVATAGFYLMSINEGFKLSEGDKFMLMCAVANAVHILIIDRFAGELDSVKLTCMQFFFAAVICGVLMFVFEKPTVQIMLDAAVPIIYLGVLSGGVAFTFQIIGQRSLPADVSSLIMSLESVFALVGGVLFLKQIPTARELCGCGLVLISVVVAQIAPRKANVGVQTVSNVGTESR